MQISCFVALQKKHFKTLIIRNKHRNDSTLLMLTIPSTYYSKLQNKQINCKFQGRRTCICMCTTRLFKFCHITNFYYGF